MRFISFLLAVFISSCTLAQPISGAVQDSSGKPLTHVTIALLKAQDSTVATYTVTSADGRFSFPIAVAARYLIRATTTGFADFQSQVFEVKDTSIMLPAFKLTPMYKNLGEVRITAQKPLIDVQPDKVVFNVESSINATGTNVLELIRKAPGALVDKDDNISLSGKNGVKVYIDGRPSPLGAQDLAAYLRGLFSADVEAIEIITNPSARYEAAGSAGILNIRFKKNKALGMNASITGAWSIGTYSKYTTSFSSNYRTKAINLFGTYSCNRSLNESYLNLYRLQTDSVYDQRSTTRYRLKAHNIKLGTDWFINAKQTIGMLIYTNFAAGNSQTESRTPISAQISREPSRILEANSTGKNDRSNNTVNLNYRYSITKDKTFAMDADYGNYDLFGQSYVPNTYRDNNAVFISESVFGNSTPVNISLYSIKADYEQPLKGGKLASGFKSAYVRTGNTFNFYNYTNGLPVFDNSRSNQFNYQEQIHAIYTQYQKTKKKWNYQAGARLEQTISRGRLVSKNAIADKDVKRHYLDLFLSGGVVYKFNEKHSAGGSFSSRIDRPSYQDLNPFENRLDDLTYQKGNPFLRPQYTTNVEIKHTYNYTLNTTLSYSRINRLFAAITDTVEGQRNFITRRNLAVQKVVSLSSSYVFTIAKWWSGFASAGINYNRYKAQFEQGKTINLTTLVANVYQKHTFLINKKWSGELSSFYSSPYVWAATYKCRSTWSVDIGVSRKILKDNGSIRLSGSDLFSRMPWTGTSRFGGLVINAGGGWESRLLKLSFSYRFGNAQVKAARQRASGIEELNRRVQ